MCDFVEVEKQMTIYSESAAKQICAKQDAVFFFKIDEEEGWTKEEGDQPVDVIVVFDGHGPDLVIDIIRDFNLEEHFKKTEPVESIQQAIDKNIHERPFRIDEKIVNRSGSTISFAKIYRNIVTKKMLIHMEWLGDSPILVFVNGEILFSSEIHSPSNEREIEILKKRGIPFRIVDTDFGFKILNEECIGNNPGKYVIFDEKIQMAFTRSLGHGRITYTESQKHIIECNTDDEVKVLIFSDGVGDILNMNMDVERLKTYSAQEIVDLAEHRWKQTWKYENESFSFENNEYDDCSCVIWGQKNENNPEN